MSILQRIIEFLFPSVKLTERQKDLMIKHFKFAEHMAEHGYRFRVGDRGGMGWVKTEPDEFYEGKPCPWREYDRIREKNNS